MKNLIASKVLLAGLLAIMSLATASASSFTYELTCVLNPAGGNPCQPGPSYGTVTIVDSGVNQVGLTVAVFNSAIKFRDLMLNFTGTGFTDITSSDGQNLVISPNGYVLTPFIGQFDLGAVDQKGWDTAATPYNVTLTGVGNTLNASMFNALDTNGKVYLAIHLQNIGSASGGNCSGDSTACAPGITGPGSLKVGGTISAIPEPATFGLVGVGLLALGLLTRRRVQ